MNYDKAIKFLKEHQPLPPDEELTEKLITKYDKVRKYFLLYPDDNVIFLFLNSYGDGDGLGVYPLVEDVFLNCNKDKVILEIKKVLENQNTPESIRYWVTQTALTFLDESLREGLYLSLKSNRDDTREVAEMALNDLE